LEEVADATASAVNELRRSYGEFQVQNGNLVEKIAKEAEELRVSIDSVQSAAQGFKGLDEALEKSFEAINEGLREYRDTTKDGLEKYLESYANTFSQFASKLSGAVEQLGDMVEDLQATVEKRSRM
jgi:methyl-accepting chemotaxis protein